jgi:hypothetical protein
MVDNLKVKPKLGNGSARNHLFRFFTVRAADEAAAAAMRVFVIF